MLKKNKIICTIGPKTESISMIYKLLINGMNIARINMSHGSYNEYINRIKNIKYVSKQTKKYIPILFDTKGPEIRIKNFKNSTFVNLKKNQDFIISCNETFNNNNNDINYVSTTYNNLYNNININNKILLDDGLISMKVFNKKNNLIFCKVLNSGILEENKKLHVLKKDINLPYINDNDKKDLDFICKNDVDFIALSFVRSKEDIRLVKKILNKYNKKILIISKIENKLGIKNINEIIRESDAIMIARGDLGINIPIENVIFKQKEIIKKCNLNNKSVITATHMLESMIKNLYPTRAEVGDISNSILDGTDCVMLSGESAKGFYPIESVKIMNKVCIKTDKEINILNKKIYTNKKFNILNINIFNLIVVITNNFDFIQNIKKLNNNYILNITTDFICYKKSFLSKNTFSEFVNNFSFDIKYINKIILKNNLLKNNNHYILIYNDKYILNKKCNILSLIKYEKN